MKAGLKKALRVGGYTIGGLFIFTAGPKFGLIQIFEVAGATVYAVGYILLGRRA